MVSGSWLMAHGSWFIVHGSWFVVHGSWFMVHGSCFMVCGSWFAATVHEDVSWLMFHISPWLTIHGSMLYDSARLAAHGACLMAHVSCSSWLMTHGS